MGKYDDIKLLSNNDLARLTLGDKSRFDSIVMESVKAPSVKGSGVAPRAPIPPTWPGGLTQAPIVWAESDWGIIVSDGQLAPSWGDRSGNGLDFATMTGMLAPTYRANGAGAGLPSLEFANAQGMQTATSALLSVTSFTMFILGIRGNTDGNGDFYELFSNPGPYISAGFRDRAFGLYVERSASGFHSAKEKVNGSTTWIPRNTRKQFRHDYNGTHVSNKLYMNDVDQALLTAAGAGNSNDPGLSAAGNSSIHIGARDSGTPSLNLTGHIMAILMYSPILSLSDAALVSTYLQRWSPA